MRTSASVWLSRAETNSQIRVQWPGGVCEPVGSAQYSTTILDSSFSVADSVSSSSACPTTVFLESRARPVHASVWSLQ